MISDYLAGTVAALLVVGAPAIAQDAYPVKPIRVITAEAGGGLDVAARIIAQGLTHNLGQQVVVDNRGGASGAIAIATAARALSDGYTLLLYSNALWVLPFLRSNVGYDPVNDFSPVTLAASSPNILVTHPSLAAGSVKDLITLLKGRPGGVSYASGGPGSTPHLAAELFKSMAGVDIVHVPYKGSGPAMNDLIAGHVQMMFPVAASVMPHVKSGRLRALAVTSSKPSSLVPDLPTMTAAGLPGYESIQMFGIYAPARTPRTIINRLNQELLRVLGSAEVKNRLFIAGAEVVGSSPEQMVAAVKSDMTRVGKVIKDAGIRAE